jgi:O-glycosyl hydrolase
MICYFITAKILMKYIQNNGNIEVPKHTWALGNYTRFLTGATRIDLSLSDDADGAVYGSAFINEEKGQTYIIMVNSLKTEQNVTLEGLDLSGKNTEVYITSDKYNLKKAGSADLGAGYLLPSQSVVTFVIGG